MKRLRRDKIFGWVCPPNAMYVGRPSVWGNPFKVGKYYMNLQMLMAIGFIKDDADYKKYWIKWKGILITDIDLCLSLYRLWLDYMLKNFPDKYNLSELLKYEYLCCYCKLTDPCHVDVLIEYCEELKNEI